MPLDGHGQGRDGQFSPQVIAHRPANDLPGAEIKHDSQIEPTLSGWYIGYIGESYLIGAFGSEFLVEAVGGDRKIMAAVRGA